MRERSLCCGVATKNLPSQHSATKVKRWNLRATRLEAMMRLQQPKLDERIVRKMRRVLEGAGVTASEGKRVKMAEKILKKAARGKPASHEELKDAAIEVGKPVAK